MNLPNPELLQGNQQVYEAVQRQITQHNLEPVRMIVSGTAGRGKSFLIGCLKRLLGEWLHFALGTASPYKRRNDKT